MKNWRLSLAAAASLACLLAPVSGRADPPAFNVKTNPFTFGQAPDWMPDGVHVVHHADRGEGNQIYVANLDGSDEKCLTCGQPGPNMVPDSRPQGDVVLFHSWRGTNITLGAPGFGGLGSDLYVVPATGGDAVALTHDHDGYDNYHAYFSPDGNRIVWTRLNWNFVTDTGRGYWDIRVADYVAEPVPHLENITVVHEGPGHYFETQHWKPDGCGFLFTESVDTTLNLELFYLDLCKDESDPTRIRRLTNHPAWDEQAIFTPDQTKVIFMSTRDHPSLWNTWANAFWSAGTPAGRSSRCSRSGSCSRSPRPPTTSTSSTSNIPNRCAVSPTTATTAGSFPSSFGTPRASGCYGPSRSTTTASACSSLQILSGTPRSSPRCCRIRRFPT